VFPSGLVVKWHRHLAVVVLVRRVFVVQLRVVTGRPSPLEPTYVYQHLQDLSPGERPPRHHSVQYVRWIPVSGGVIGWINPRRAQLLVGWRTTAFAIA
jgi:hypothetical protein